jgi:hypothetical protein
MRLAFYYHATTVEQKITNLLPNHKTILPVKPGANRCNWTWTPDVSMTGIFFYHRTVAAGRMFTNLIPNQMSLFLSFFTQAIGGSWTQNPGIELTRLAFYRHVTAVSQMITNLLPNPKTLCHYADRGSWTRTPEPLVFCHHVITVGQMKTNLLPNHKTFFYPFHLMPWR